MPTTKQDDKAKPKTTRAVKSAVSKTAKPALAKTGDKIKKPRTIRKKALAVSEATPATAIVPAAATILVAAGTETTLTMGKPKIAGGRYVFATGRRKTAVANVRMFSGKGDNLVNKKPLNTYFAHSIYQNEIMKPLEVTGLAGDFFFTATINGGGIHAQSQALRHGLAQALASFNDEIKRILKKNTFLTRDDRKKERKKPGLKRARRSPQWAKR